MFLGFLGVRRGPCEGPGAGPAGAEPAHERGAHRVRPERDSQGE
jgi:hypothetical protein